MENKVTYLQQIMEQDVPIIEFEQFSKTGLVKHGFTTKKGGVSKGYFSTMNLGLTRGDNKEAVIENFKIIANRLQVDYEKMVLSAQTHTTNIKIIKKEDAGKGLKKEKDYDDIDGLITNVRGIVLVTFYADCVPLLFLDPVKKVIASSHSGWRGTVSKMGKETVERMKQEFGCEPKDILACIGPSICQKCYEVSEDVAKEFEKEFQSSEMFYKKENGKYQLDLWKANRMVLLEAGIQEKNIENREICTCCNSEYLFSHRATNGKRGNLAAFLSLN